MVIDTKKKATASERIRAAREHRFALIEGGRIVGKTQALELVYDDDSTAGTPDHNRKV